MELRSDSASIGKNKDVSIPAHPPPQAANGHAQVQEKLREMQRLKPHPTTKNGGEGSLALSDARDPASDVANKAGGQLAVDACSHSARWRRQTGGDRLNFPAPKNYKRLNERLATINTRKLFGRHENLNGAQGYLQLFGLYERLHTSVGSHIGCCGGELGRTRVRFGKATATRRRPCGLRRRRIRRGRRGRVASIG